MNSIPNFEDLRKLPLKACPRSKLEAVVALSIVAAPSTVPLNAPHTDQPVEIIFDARIKWSTRPAEPLTLSAWGNLFRTPGDEGTIVWFLCLRPVGDLKEARPLRYVSSAFRHNVKYPNGDDWREKMEWVTIPAQDGGESLRVTRTLARKWLARSGLIPRADRDYVLSVDPKRSVVWWNWGSLDGTLAGKRLVNIPRPDISGREEGLGADDVLSYGAWEDEDEEGNEMRYLDFEAEGELPIVKLISLPLLCWQGQSAAGLCLQHVQDPLCSRIALHPLLPMLCQVTDLRSPHRSSGSFL